MKAFAAATDAQHSVSVSLTANGTDPNRDDVLTVRALNTTGTQGTVSLNATGTQGTVSLNASDTGVVYSPGSAFTYLSVGETATDTFGYTIADGHGGTASSTATVTVTGVNLPPWAPGRPWSNGWRPNRPPGAAPPRRSIRPA